MADTTTTNLLLTKPEVGASTDTWGTKINTDLDSVDAIFAAAGTGTSVGLNVGSGKSLKLVGDVIDTNGNELLKVTATASAVNELTLANAATGGAPTLTASGSDTNIGMKLVGKGTGEVTARVNGSDVFNASSNFGFKNRIINGAMVIDVRNAGASVTLNGSESYITDRFACGDVTDGSFTAQQVSDAPAGFINSLKCTITSADSSLTTTQTAYCYQTIEGLNIADFAWGTASATTITLSFWIKSSLTGTFGGALRNSAANRAYPFTYAISAANTWEQKTVTIAGDTSGTWLTTNGAGINLQFSLGAGPDRLGTAGAWNANNNVGATGQVQVIGTNGATWQVTGVQLEKGSTATSFDYRPYGTELALCQRYYQRYAANASYLYITNWGSGASATSMRTTISPKVSFRVAPTSLDYANIALDDHASVFTATSVTTYGSGSVDTIGIVINVASGLTQFRPYVGTSTTSNGYIGLSAEL
jgi:hypothetical protein